MIASLQLTTSLIGLGLAVVIVMLLRRDHIYVLHALFWIVVAALAALLGLWPGLIDRAAAWVGITYPPAALLLGAVVVLFIKSLYADIANTQLERQLRRLNQRVALLDVQNPPGMESLPTQTGFSGLSRSEHKPEQTASSAD